jgi:lipopolysaccharide biosynthesis glycosyltransferase
MDRVRIALTANRSFCRQVAVVIAGISRSCEIDHDVFVLHDGFDRELQDRVDRAASSRVRVHWIDATTPLLSQAHRPPHLPLATLFRLRLEELLPADTDRVIYVDCDVVVRRPLTELWQLDLGDTLLGAVRDPFMPWAGAPHNLDWRAVGIPPDTRYFNGGLLLIPLRRWRECAVSERALQLVVQHQFGDAEQGALNVVAAGNWTALHPRWNLQAAHIVTDESYAWVVESPARLEEARRDPAVLHLTRGPWRKPWDDRGAVGAQAPHPWREEWFEELDRTDWAGWRPNEARPSRRSGLARRLQRAGDALRGRPGGP